MDFGLSDEHSALQDAARQFVERHYPPRQAKEWDKTNTYPHLLLKAMAEIGWFGLAFPAEAGGDGGGPIELAIVTEQLGRASLDIAMCFVGTLIPSLTIFLAVGSSATTLLAGFDGRPRRVWAMVVIDSPVTFFYLFRGDGRAEQSSPDS